MTLKEYESLIFRTRLQVVQGLVCNLRDDNEELNLVDEETLAIISSNLRTMICSLTPRFEEDNGS